MSNAASFPTGNEGLESDLHESFINSNFDWNTIFDWDKYAANTASSNGSSPSEGSSEESSLTGSSAPTSRLSVPPSPGRDPYHVPRHSPKVTAGEVRALKVGDGLLIPPLSEPPPRDTHINIHTAVSGEHPFGHPPASPSYSYLAPAMPHSDIPSPGGTPSRILKNPIQTASLRSVGACILCRIGKVACDLKAPCAQCVKVCEKLNSDSATETCRRQDPAGIVGSQRTRWTWLLSQVAMPRPIQFRGPSTEILLSFSGAQGSCPTLQIKVARYIAHDANGVPVSRLGIAPDQTEAPLERAMLDWIENQRNFETRTDFGGQVEQMLRAFVSQDVLHRIASVEDQSETQAAPLRKQNELMNNILNMSAMWRIWSARELFVRRPGQHADTPFPIRIELESVQAQLKLCAGTTLSRLEGEVVSGISSYLTPASLRKSECPGLWAAMNVAMWLSLMQLILLYRETENPVLVQHRTYTLAVNIGASGERLRFRQTTKELLDSLVVIYSGQFRTSSVLQSLNSAGPEAFGQDNYLCLNFQKTWKSRQTFYHDIKLQIQPSDKLINDHVVTKEEQVFRRKKSSCKKQ